MALNYTLEEIRTRRENAIKLLNTHTDKYRTLYATVYGINEPTDDNIALIERKKKMLDFESYTIHRQLDLLSELENCVRKEESVES